MFCDNASYQTQKMAKNCVNYCTGQQNNRLLSYQDLHTQQSQRNPSNYYHTINTQREQRFKTRQLQQNNLKQINQMQALQVMHEHTKRENEHLKAITRNKKIAAILSTIIAFSQRIEGIKQKLAGYPAESFSPVQFFNVLDLTEKGYVDLYDVKRFVNNEKISEKDILSLFKKVNGDHSKDNSRLSYFGYLNLIKPYFNEHLARDLLLRDSKKIAKKHKQQSRKISQRNDFDIMQPTQQSVLLLFQQLMLLHCICVSEHEQGKQQLMSEYMLNVIEIKEIIGLDSRISQSIGNINQKRSSSPSIISSSLYTNNNNKSPLKILYDFIQNNSQFEIEFKEMKYILAFLTNAHQSQLVSQKYLSLLFIPMNCKRQLMKHFQLEEEKGQSLGNNNKNKKIAMENYMNTYLTRDNLINKGNILPIKEYLRAQNNGNNYYGHEQQQQRGINSLTQNHMNLTSSSSKNKMNFLQFVHPKSLQRMMGADNYNDNNFLSQQQQLMMMQQPYNYIISQHPQMQQINASNKYLLLGQNANKRSAGNNNILGQQQQQQLLQHYLSNNPSLTRSNNNNNIIPQQNIIINLPKKQIEKRRQYPYLYQQQQKQQYQQKQQQINNNSININNASIISHTPFLQKFMKNDNHNGNKNNYNRQQNQQQNRQQNRQQQNRQQEDYSINNGDSKISDSAFQVIDYGYQINNYQQQRSNKYDRSNNNKKIYQQQYPNNKINDQSQSHKKQTLDSRYNLVISQYKNSQLYPPNNHTNINKNNNNILQPPTTNKGHNNNYILDRVGLSQSNMIVNSNNQSNFMNKFYSNNNNNSVIGGGGGNILNEFLKKQ